METNLDGFELGGSNIGYRTKNGSSHQRKKKLLYVITTTLVNKLIK